MAGVQIDLRTGVEKSAEVSQKVLAAIAADAKAREARRALELKPYQAQRRDLYVVRILALKGAPEASPLDAIGFVLDALIMAVAGGDDTDLRAIAAEIVKVKREVPKP